MTAASPITLLPDRVRFTVVVSPRAKRSQVKGIYGDAIKIAVAAAPADGEANAALVELISEVLDLPKRCIEIISGVTSTRKIIEVRSERPAQTYARLQEIIP